MTYKKYYKLIQRFLIALGFKKIETSKNMHYWSQPDKLINFQIDVSRGKINPIKYITLDFLKLIKENLRRPEYCL